MTDYDDRFDDRVQAGQMLAEKLANMQLDAPLIFALPRGGVPVAAEVARRLGAPMDLILVRKIGAPGNPELALGSIAEGAEEEAVVNEDVWLMTGADPLYFNKAKAEQEAELARRSQRYLGDRPRLDPSHRNVVVIDDGLATGATMKAALAALRHRGARRIIVGLPVAPADALHALDDLADDVVCLRAEARFHGVGAFYRDFHQLSDEETVALLDRANGRAP
ncbi:phosphoribosyltransferase [Marimonas sp. MJW-29]|uniref:Phosphoribosyltransferase n=1 Tax=Sulfitobacter sediminis TaxID=3234186 RepID=A0ABV3RK46_9RHOB